jgi:nucleoside-triphosphatase THEP1
LVSPGVFRADEKIAIDGMDISNGERVRLANLSNGDSAGVSTQRWTFLPEAVAWGNQVLQSAIPCDLLVIDELGPLEFLRSEGWMTGFEVVATGEYQEALLVIRPSLLTHAVSRWPVKRIINLDDPEEPFRSGKDLFQALMDFPG